MQNFEQEIEGYTIHDGGKNIVYTDDKKFLQYSSMNNAKLFDKLRNF